MAEDEEVGDKEALALLQHLVGEVGDQEGCLGEPGGDQGDQGTRVTRVPHLGLAKCSHFLHFSYSLSTHDLSLPLGTLQVEAVK